jgi:hypothetical protein
VEKMSTVTAIGVTQMGEFIYDKELAALDAQDERDELIAKIKDEMIARRKAEMSDDDIQASLEHCTKSAAGLIRAAMQKKNQILALDSLEILFDVWLAYDCELEAIKSVERTENERA